MARFLWRMKITKKAAAMWIWLQEMVIIVRQILAITPLSRLVSKVNIRLYLHRSTMKLTFFLPSQLLAKAVKTHPKASKS